MTSYPQNAGTEHAGFAVPMGKRVKRVQNKSAANEQGKTHNEGVFEARSRKRLLVAHRYPDVIDEPQYQPKRLHANGGPRRRFRARTLFDSHATEWACRGSFL